MKLIQIIAAIALPLLGALRGQAAITIPGADGSDGALNITTDTVIDLSQAVTGAWDANNTANAGKGVYDPTKWAVVFKYSSVTVAAGKTVTFKNHASRAPVVWLISGNATISGTVNLDGVTAAYNSPQLADPGPGGFRGGQGYFTVGVGRGAGFGVGGGSNTGANSYGQGGSYGSQGQGGPAIYGNPSIVPLIGGSGGGGYYNDARGGGGGAGAILIACANSLSIGGTIRADGGGSGGGTGGGSGGAVRLVAESLAGSGVVRCLGGGGSYAGGLGRVRIERVNNSSSITVNPDPSVVPLAPSDTALVWPPSGAPEVKIISIGGQAISSDPLASFGTYVADATLPQTATTQILVETTNVEQASQVKVRGTPRSNGDYTEVSAAVSSVVSTTPLVVRWTATLPVAIGYAAVQVKVIRP